MPTVNIRMYEGRSDDLKERMAAEVKQVVATHTNNKIESVKVIYEEIPRPQAAEATAPAAQP